MWPFEFECVFVWQNDTTSIFLAASLKFGACYVTGQSVSEVISAAQYKELFFGFFVLFHHKISGFIIFISFLMKYQISAAEINQSETEIIGGPKLSIVSAGGTLAIAKKKKKNFMAPFFYGWG